MFFQEIAAGIRDAGECHCSAAGEDDHEVTDVGDALVEQFTGLNTCAEAIVEQADDFAWLVVDDGGEQFEHSFVAGSTEHAVNVFGGDGAFAEGEELVEE